MRGRLGSYAAWQVRDFAFERGFPMLIVSSLLLFPVIMGVRAIRLQAPAGMDVAGMATGALVQAMPLLGFVLVLLAVNGIISNDRKRGYYRFLFAKPVTMVRYYAQAFAVAAAGMLLVGAIVLAFFYALAYPILAWQTIPFLALHFIGLGGIVFLVSSIFRADWILIAGLWMMSSVLRSLYPAGDSWYGQLFHVVLPPTHLVGELAAALIRGGPVPAMSVLWLAGYGAAAFVLGLVLLARRPLAS